MADPNNVLWFDDKTLFSRYRLPHTMILQLAMQLWPSLERLTRQHRDPLVVVVVVFSIKLLN